MSDAIHMSAPAAVAGRHIGNGHFIEVSEISAGQITLRGDFASDAFAKAVKDAVGVDLPEPRQAAFEGDTGAVWMSPDELLLVMPRDRVAEALAQFNETLAGTHHMALDVSDARVVLRLEGDLVPEVLAKGAPVDLSDAAFPIGACRRTHLAEIAVGFWRRDATVWEIVCFRSFSQHLLDWLETASRDATRVNHF